MVSGIDIDYNRPAGSFLPACPAFWGSQYLGGVILTVSGRCFGMLQYCNTWVVYSRGVIYNVPADIPSYAVIRRQSTPESSPRSKIYCYSSIPQWHMFYRYWHTSTCTARRIYYGHPSTRTLPERYHRTANPPISVLLLCFCC